MDMITATATQFCDIHGVAMTPGPSCTYGEIAFVPPPSCVLCLDATRRDMQAREAKAEAGRFRQRQADAQIPRRYLSARLEGIITETPKQREILEIVTSFTSSYGTDPSALVLIGTLGSGKTYAGCAAANEFLRGGRSALYTTALALIRQLRSRWGSRGETEEQLFRKLVEKNLLVLDEVGVQVNSASEQATIGNLLDARYADGRPTVVIGNLTLSELGATLGERILDRFKQGGKVLVFDWPSRRPRFAHEHIEELPVPPRVVL